MPTRTDRPIYPAIDYGPLPMDAISAVLGTSLAPGTERLSAQAHRHMAEDHPAGYALRLSLLASVIARPTFVRQAPGQVRAFEIIRRVALSKGQFVLVAFSIDRDGQGHCRIRSSDLVNNETIDKRLFA